MEMKIFTTHKISNDTELHVFKTDDPNDTNIYFLGSEIAKIAGYKPRHNTYDVQSMVRCFRRSPYISESETRYLTKVKICDDSANELNISRFPFIFLTQTGILCFMKVRLDRFKFEHKAHICNIINMYMSEMSKYKASTKVGLQQGGKY
jgi:hypothetical protein